MSSRRATAVLLCGTAIVSLTIGLGLLADRSPLWTSLDQSVIRGGATCWVLCVPDGECPDAQASGSCSSFSGVTACVPLEPGNPFSSYECHENWGLLSDDEYYHDHCSGLEDMGWTECDGEYHDCQTYETCGSHCTPNSEGTYVCDSEDDEFGGGEVWQRTEAGTGC